MATRLLDWSTNPLVGLWFACLESTTPDAAHLYMYRCGKDVMLDPAVDTDPFSFSVTKIFQPPHNNARLVAQSGWFTVHTYYGGLGKIKGFEEFKQFESFKGLGEDMMHTISVFHFEIPADQKQVILAMLDVLGVNHRSLFPDLDGLCHQITWENFKLIQPID